jgi:hypothetical protein
LTQALVWFFGVRSYSCSRGLIFPINKYGSGDYDIVCLLYIPNFYDFDMEISAFNHCFSYVMGCG